MRFVFRRKRPGNPGDWDDAPLHSPCVARSTRTRAKLADAVTILNCPHGHPRSFVVVLLRTTWALELAHLVDFIFGVHAY